MRRDSKNDAYIYEALNYYNVDESIDTDKIEEVDDITKKRIRKLINKKVKVNKPKHKGIMIAGIGLFIAANIILVSAGGVDVYANIGKSIMSSIAKIRGDNEEYDKYSNSINASVTDKGIKFVINEVVSDGNQLVMSYSIISEGNLKDKIRNLNINPWPSINGQMLSGLSRDGNMVSENRYDGCDWIKDSKGIIPKGDFYVDVTLKDIGDLKGNWDIRVKVDSDKIKKEVKEYSINKTFKTGDNDNLTIKKIITSPLSVGIKAVANYEQYYRVLDDKGNQLEWKETHGSDDSMTMDYSGLLSKDTKSLTFVPLKFKKNQYPSFDVYSLESLPIKVDQGVYGSVTVNKAEWIENDKLRISYDVDSKYPLTASYAPTILDPNGKVMDSDSLDNFQISRDNQKNFEKVFSGLDKNKMYKLGIQRIYEEHLLQEDKQFTVDLKN